MKQETKDKLRTTFFWSGIASSILIFIQNIGLLFGFEVPADKSAQIMAAVNSFLAILTFSGVLVDTKEVSSFQAMKLKIKK